MKLYFYEYREEEFKEVKYPDIIECGYIVSSHGRVFSNITNRFLQPSRTFKDYLTVNLKTITGDQKRVPVHRLVAFEFCEGRSESRNFVNHKDSDRQFNNIINLEWVTRKENDEHGRKYGMVRESLLSRGFNFYEEEFIHKICYELEQGTKQSIILKMCITDGISKSAAKRLIYSLKYKQGWKDITSEYNYDFGDNAGFTIYGDELICEICRLLEMKYETGEIVSKINKDNLYDYKKLTKIIWNVKNKKTHVKISDMYNI